MIQLYMTQMYCLFEVYPYSTTLRNWLRFVAAGGTRRLDGPIRGLHTLRGNGVEPLAV